MAIGLQRRDAADVSAVGKFTVFLRNNSGNVCPFFDPARFADQCQIVHINSAFGILSVFLVGDFAGEMLGNINRCQGIHLLMGEIHRAMVIGNSLYYRGRKTPQPQKIGADFGMAGTEVLGFGLGN